MTELMKAIREDVRADHNETVNEEIYQFYQKDKLTDVKLVTETKTFEAHKLILSSYSPYFRKLFEENPKTTTMHFKDIPASHMEPLIDFMYTGKVSVKEADILETARSLQLTGYGTESRPSSASSGQLSNSGKRKAYGGGGRKSSHPKKLRQNSRDEPEESVCFHALSRDKSPEKHVSAGQEHVIARPSCSYDDIAASEDEGELVIDQQPVDFSASRPSPAPAFYNYKPISLEPLQMAAPMMGTWEEQLAKRQVATANASKKEEEEKKGTSLQMAAAQLQLHTHFLASLSKLQEGMKKTSPNTPEAGKKGRGPTPPRAGEIGDNGKVSVKCEECGKVLTDPSSLYRHRKIHTGEKPHKCPFCPKAFVQRYNMKQHIRTHREVSTEQKEAVLADPEVGRSPKGNPLGACRQGPIGLNGPDSSQGPAHP